MRIHHADARPSRYEQLQGVITDMISGWVTAEYWCFGLCHLCLTHSWSDIGNALQSLSLRQCQCTDQQVPPHLIGANKGGLVCLPEEMQLGVYLPSSWAEMPEIQPNHPINNPNLTSLNSPPYHTQYQAPTTQLPLASIHLPASAVITTSVVPQQATPKASHKSSNLWVLCLCSAGSPSFLTSGVAGIFQSNLDPIHHQPI